MSCWNQAMSHPQAGAGVALFSYLAFTWMDGLVQVVVSRGVSLGETYFLRQVINLGIYLPFYLIWNRETLMKMFIPSPILKWLWSRGLFSALSQACAYMALYRLNLSEFLTLIHLRPFVVAIVGWAFFKETPNRRQFTACTISFAAVLLVVQPNFLFHAHIDTDAANPGGDLNRLMGVLFTMGCVLSSTFEMLIVSKIGDEFSANDMTFAYVVHGSGLGAVWAFVPEDGFTLNMDLQAVCLVVFIVACGLSSQVAFVTALQKTTGTQVAIIGYFQIIFSSIVQTILFGKPPNVIEGCGMAIIMLAGIWCLMGSGQSDIAEEDGYTRLPLTATSQQDSATRSVRLDHEALARLKPESGSVPDSLGGARA